jgi:hypothetical protein
MKATKPIGNLSRDQMLALVAEAAERLPPVWVIYDHPDDIPGAFVVRCWYGEVPHPDVFLTQSAERAREYCINEGASVPLARDSNDDPRIMEAWI